MSYSFGNTISSSNFMNFRGPYGPDVPYPSDDIDPIAVAALIGVGYGTRGYGQTNTFLPPANSQNRISSVEWNAMQSAMNTLNIHTGSGLVLQPTVGVNGRIIVEDGTDGSANIEMLATTLDLNRLQYDINQMTSNVVLTSVRTTPWDTTIQHEFTVDFETEDNARYFFNSGGEIIISANRTNGSSNTAITSQSFESPSVYQVSNQYWSTFLQQYGVWVDPDPYTSSYSGITQDYYRNFYATYTGYYTVAFQAAGNLNLYIDEVLIGNSYNYSGEPNSITLILASGNHVLRFEQTNSVSAIINSTWLQNPSGWATTVNDSNSNVTFDTISSASQDLIDSTEFLSPPVIVTSSNTWNDFMNANAVRLDIAAFSVPTELLSNPYTATIHRILTIPLSGNYTFTYAADYSMNIYINNGLILSADVLSSRSYDVPYSSEIMLTSGEYVLRIDSEIQPNFGGWALVITDSDNNLIWKTQNYLAATLIPSPYGPNFNANPAPFNTNITNMLQYAGNVSLGANATAIEGIGESYDIGFYQLTNTYSTVFSTFDQSVVYNNDAVYLTTFTSPNTYQYVVPDNVTALTAKLWGAGGSGVPTQSNDSVAWPGAAGAFVTGTFNVTPGETLTIMVAGPGLPGSIGNNYANTIGGGGGGFSAIFRGNNPLIIAAGGGGSSANFTAINSGKGGAGGIETGSSSSTGLSANNAGGGNQTSGGQGGSGAIVSGLSGEFLSGANGSTSIPLSNGGTNGGGQGGYYGVGGGGGGYFGGGSGGANDQTDTSGGGAGGSSYISPLVTDVLTAVSTDWYTAPAITDPDYITGYAQGNLSEGGKGLVVLYSAESFIPQNVSNWIISGRVENVQGVNGGNGSLIRFLSTVNTFGSVDGDTSSVIGTQTATGVLNISNPIISTVSGFDYDLPISDLSDYISGQILTTVYNDTGLKWSGIPLTSNFNIVPIYEYFNNYNDAANYFGFLNSNIILPSTFCSRYSAYLQVPVSGVWTLSVEHSHPVWLWINQTLVLYKNTPGVDTCTINLGSDRFYSLQINNDYNTEIYPYKLIARWTAPNLSIPTIIPADAFSFNNVNPPFINLPPVSNN